MPRRKYIDRVLPRGCCRLMATVTAVRQKTPVDDFYCEELPSIHSSQPACVYRNDIFMVLAQKRFDSMTQEQFSRYLDHDRSCTQLQSIRSRMSDDQLFSFVKSRYIQHPAELRAWSAYIQTELSSKAEQYVSSKISSPELGNKISSPEPGNASAPAPSAE